MKGISNEVLTSVAPSSDGSQMLKTELEGETFKFQYIRPAKGADLKSNTNEKNKFSRVVFENISSGELISYTLSTFLGFTVKDEEDKHHPILTYASKTEELTFTISNVKNIKDYDGNKVYSYTSYKKYRKLYKDYFKLPENKSLSKEDFFKAHPNIRNEKSKWTVDTDAKPFSTCIVTIQ